MLRFLEREEIRLQSSPLEEGMGMLEIAAQTGDEATFVHVASEVNWAERPSDDLARAVRLALAAGAHLFARNLAAEGARLYPNHHELRKMARLLAPPRIVHTDRPSVPSVEPNHEWLRSHSTEYRGRWVALRNGELLAAGSAARELKAQLDTLEGVLLTRVL